MARNLHGNRTLRDIAREALAALGGHATNPELVDKALTIMTASEYRALTDGAIRSGIVNGAKSTVKQEHEMAVYAKGDGEVSQLQFFSREEMIALSRDLAHRGHDLYDAICEVNRICMKIHGQGFDVDEIWRERGA